MQLGNVSAELQEKEDGELEQMAIKLGWLSESEWTPGCGKGKIVKFPQDMAVSGRLRMEDRVGFKKMLQAIISGEAGAVLCIEVDRLFRDKYGQESGKFMEICEKYGVIVITPRQIYDFRNSGDISDFKEEAARAWDYMQRQIYDKMVYAQDHLAETGRIGRGRNINVGYRLDRDPRSKTYRHLIPYPPHADKFKQLYVRYRELGNSMTRLYHEIKDRPYFPDFPEDTDPRDIHALILSKVPGGYTFGARTGLRRAMCNPVYIGWMRLGSDIVRNADGTPKICHEPVVDEADFWNVFNRHSAYLLDGESNPNVRKWRDRNKYTPLDAWLRHIIQPADPKLRIATAAINHGDQRTSDDASYYFYDAKDEFRSGKLHIAAREVDGAFWQMLKEHLRATKDFQVYATHEAETEAAKEREKQEILEQIAACDRLIEKQTDKIVALDIQPQDAHQQQTIKPGDEHRQQAIKLMVEKIQADITDKLQEKKRLQERLQTFMNTDNKYAQDMEEWKEHIEGIEDIDELKKDSTAEERQELAEVFATSATLEALSLRVFKLSVQWRHPDWKPKSAIWIRQTVSGKDWPEEERERLREVWGTLSHLDLMKAFPLRSWQGIKRMALDLRLQPSVPWKGPLDSNRLSWTDWQVVQELELVPDHIRVIECDRMHFHSSKSNGGASHRKREE